jgi:hypothetical protein
MILGCNEASSSNLVPPVSAVSVSVAQDSATLGGGETFQFTATVTGTSNTAVEWSVSGCTGPSCGTISSTGLYTAPSLIPAEITVTITATSDADSTKFDTATVRQMPITVSIAASAGTMALPSRTLNFTATVQYDSTNSGVDWTLGPTCPNPACGTLTDVALDSVTYTAPANIPDAPTVTLTATSIKDVNKSAKVTITITAAATSGLLEGDYAFLFSGDTTDVVGRFHADSSGNITEGIEDVNLFSSVSQSAAFTGTYSISADRRGSLNITTTQGTATYGMTVSPSGDKGRFVQLGGSGTGTGYFERQEKAAFSLSALSGPYAIEMARWMGDAIGVGAVGRFTASASGTFGEGRMDVTMLSGVPETFTELTLTGAFTAPTSNSGRGTAFVTLTPAPGETTGTFNFAYYIVSSEKILIMGTDPVGSTTPVLSGRIRRQNGSFSAVTLNAPVIFGLEGYTWFGTTATVGRFVPDGFGSVTGAFDQNGEASLLESLTLNQDFLGSYSVDWDGRATMSVQVSPTDKYSAIAYLFGQNEGFLMSIDLGGAGIQLGSLKQQAAGPFTSVSVSDSFRTNTIVPRQDWRGNNYSGLTAFDGAGEVSATIDASQNHYDFQGTYSLSANGRRTLTFTSPLPERPLVFWVVSPTELVGIFTVATNDTSPVVLLYEKLGFLWFLNDSC